MVLVASDWGVLCCIAVIAAAAIHLAVLARDSRQASVQPQHGSPTWRRLFAQKSSEPACHGKAHMDACFDLQQLGAAMRMEADNPPGGRPSIDATDRPEPTSGRPAQPYGGGCWPLIRDDLPQYFGWAAGGLTGRHRNPQRRGRVTQLLASI